MRALLTNDDGIDSPGLHELARQVEAAGFEVVVVAPSFDASGTGASLGHISRSPIVAVSNRNSRVGLVAMFLNCFHEYSITTVTFPSHCCPNNLAKSKVSTHGTRSSTCVHRCRHSDSRNWAIVAKIPFFEANHRFSRRMGTMCGFVCETMK